MTRPALAALALAAAPLAAQPAPAADSAAVRSAQAPADAEVLASAEVSPAPVGGLAAVAGRVVYPPDAERDRAEGMVLVQFVVEPDGSVSDVEAVRAPDDRLAAAAVAAVQASPFSPGRQGGAAVRVRSALPVTFRLAPAPETLPEPLSETVIIQQPPEFIGGLKAFQRSIDYPRAAQQAGIEGVVVVRFVVETDGTTSNAEIVRSAALSLDLAAVEAVGRIRFTPGMQGGRPVRVRFTVPVSFRLRGSAEDRPIDNLWNGSGLPPRGRNF